MKYGLGHIEKSIKSHLEHIGDVENKNILEKELKYVEQLTKKHEKEENLEEVNCLYFMIKRSKRTIS
jgi:hypothetical protein